MRFLRDPAIILTFVASAVRLLAAFFIDITTEQQAWINAAAAAIAGAVVAVWVRREGQVPALLGAAHAIIALAVGYGLKWTPEQQAIALSFFGTLLAMFVRTQVVAPVPAEPAPVTDPVAEPDGGSSLLR